MNEKTFRRMVKNIIEGEIALQKPEEQPNQWALQEQQVVESINLLNQILEMGQIEILATSEYSVQITQGFKTLMKNLKKWDNEYNNVSPFNNSVTNNEVPYNWKMSMFNPNASLK